MALVCGAITISYGTSIIRSQEMTRASIDRFILQGPGNSHVAMHQVSLLRLDGTAMSVDVSGTASAAQLVDLVHAFGVGDDAPAGWRVTEWTIAGGTTIKVTTLPLAGESEYAYGGRHEDFIKALQEELPPVS